MESGAISQSNALRAPMVVLFNDCWSLNLSEEFRNWVEATYPFIRLRFIPASVKNDTYFHTPYKKMGKNLQLSY